MSGINIMLKGCDGLWYNTITGLIGLETFVEKVDHGRNRLSAWKWKCNNTGMGGVTCADILKRVRYHLLSQARVEGPGEKRRGRGKGRIQEECVLV